MSHLIVVNICQHTLKNQVSHDKLNSMIHLHATFTIKKQVTHGIIACSKETINLNNQVCPHICKIPCDVVQ